MYSQVLLALPTLDSADSIIHAVRGKEADLRSVAVFMHSKPECIYRAFSFNPDSFGIGIGVRK
jgi:hypothetical protein